MPWKLLVAVVLLFVAFATVWLAHEVLAAALLAGVFAVAIQHPARWLHTATRLPKPVTASFVILLVLGLLALLGWWLGPTLTDQFGRMLDELPEAVEDIRDWLARYAWGEALLERMGNGEQLTGGDKGMLAQMVSMASATMSSLVNILVFLAVTLFLAVNPDVYKGGLLKLVPTRYEGEARDVLHSLSFALGWWMLGRLTSMLVVALFTGLGMWMIGMPVPFALGVLAGLLSFVPNIGPLVSAVPGVLIALPLGGWMVLWALLVYVVVQLVESNFITPMIQQYAVAVPAALLLVTQIVLGVLVGVWGIIVATPLLLILVVLVQEIYVCHVLNKHVAVTGSHEQRHGGDG